jgi:signal transduction histidine kinase
VQGRHRAAVRSLPDDTTTSHALLDAIDLIGSAPDLDETLRRTASVAAALAQATYVSVELDVEDAWVRRVEHGDPPATQEQAPLAVDLSARGGVLGRITVRRPGPAFEASERDLASRLATLAAPLIANVLACDQGARRRWWLEGTIKVAAGLAPTTRPEDARARLVSGVREVVGAPLVALLQSVGPADDRWQLVAHDGDEAQAVAASRALGEQIAASGDAGQLMCLRRVAGLESLLIPLQTQQAPAGVLLVEHPAISAVLGSVERHLVSVFAGQVSLALDRAQAIDERQELLLAADRDRIARDLHDLVIQRLYATGLQLQAARNRGPAAVDAAITGSVRDLDASIRDLRATIFELGRGRTRSLTGEVRALVEEYAAALGFRPALRLNGPVDTVLTEAVSDDALLVLREAMSNIARHAHASAAQVELTASKAWFMLRVADDGVGIGAGPGVPSGLRNAQRRAEARGGVMRTGSATPHGTTLVWLVPAAR